MADLIFLRCIHFWGCISVTSEFGTKKTELLVRVANLMLQPANATHHRGSVYGTPLKSSTKAPSIKFVCLQLVTNAAIELTLAKGPSVAAKSLEPKIVSVTKLEQLP